MTNIKFKVLANSMKQALILKTFTGTILLELVSAFRQPPISLTIFQKPNAIHKNVPKAANDMHIFADFFGNHYMKKNRPAAEKESRNRNTAAAFGTDFQNFDK